MRKIIIFSALVFSTTAGATSYTGKIVNLTYGVDSNRVSVTVAAAHTVACSPAPFNTAYTFSGKPLWNEALVAALQSDKTINIAGTGTCTLNVEEIQNFNVVK